MKYRIENDELGEYKVPHNVYYGIKTARAKDYFSISDYKFEKEIIKSLMIIKLSIVLATKDLKLLEVQKSEDISNSIHQMLNGKHYNQFVTSAVQANAVRDVYNNLNEIIANVTNEKLGYKLGTYKYINPTSDLEIIDNPYENLLASINIFSSNFIRKIVIECVKIKKEYKSKVKLFNTYPTLKTDILQNTEDLDSCVELLKKISNSLKYIELTNKLNIENEKYSQLVSFNITKISRFQVTTRNTNGKEKTLENVRKLSYQLSKLLKLLLLLNQNLNNFVTNNQNHLVNITNKKIINNQIVLYSYYVIQKSKSILSKNHESLSNNITVVNKGQNELISMITYDIYNSLSITLETLKNVRKNLLQEVDVVKQ